MYKKDGVMAREARDASASSKHGKTTQKPRIIKFINDAFKEINLSKFYGLLSTVAGLELKATTVTVTYQENATLEQKYIP